MTAQEQLIELIDSRIKAKKFQYPAIVISVTEFSASATVKFPEGNIETQYLNKSGEALNIGDSVYIFTNDGNLTNGYISQRFGNYSSTSLNPDGSLKKAVIKAEDIGMGEIHNYQIQNGSVTTHELHNSVGHLLDITRNESVSASKYFIDTIDESLQAQLDGEMTSWFYDYPPTADNIPASDWTTIELKNFHLKDLFYDTLNKLVYRYTLLGDEYIWKIITDSNIIFALDNASHAQDTADGKRRVFTIEPTGSYDLGDLWVNVDKDLMICIQGRVADAGVVYDPLQWEKATKYTDDATLVDFMTNTYAVDSEGLQAQIDGIVDTYYTDIDPNTWVEADRVKHTGDMWYGETLNTLQRYDGTLNVWVLITDPKAIEAYANASKAQDTADDKRRVFTITPFPPYDIGDLWSGGIGSDLLKCITPKLKTGVYAAGDWEKATKYTDDTVANSAITKVNSAEQLITAFAITGTVTEDVTYTNEAGQIVTLSAASVVTQTAKNVKFGFNKIAPEVMVVDSTGLLINNGALTIKNKAGTNVFSADSLGNLVIAGVATFGQAQTLADTAQTNAQSAAITAVNNALANGTTTIDGSCITTGTINAARLNLTGLATYTQAQSLAESYASQARSDAVSAVNNSLAYGTTTIDGNCISTGTIDTERINFTGALNGYTSGTSTGITINSNGLIRVPYSAHIDFDGGSSLTYIGRTGSSYLTIYNQSGDIRITPSSYYTRITGMYAVNDPYNMPLTSPTTANKVAKLQYLSGPQIEFYIGSSDSGSATHYVVSIATSDRRLKTNITDSKINALSQINKIKLREFNWIEDMRYDNCGVIAQEIEEDIGGKYICKVDQGDGDFSYQMETYEFIPLLSKGIQELDSIQKENTTKLQNDIAVLKIICEQQQTEINQLKTA